MGVGAMTVTFGPLLANPRTKLLAGAAAQFGIFATVLGALTLNYFGSSASLLPQAAAIGIIIGGATARRRFTCRSATGAGAVKYRVVAQA